MYFTSVWTKQNLNGVDQFKNVETTTNFLFMQESWLNPIVLNGLSCYFTVSWCFPLFFRDLFCSNSVKLGTVEDSYLQKCRGIFDADSSLGGAIIVEIAVINQSTSTLFNLETCYVLLKMLIIPKMVWHKVMQLGIKIYINTPALKS